MSETIYDRMVESPKDAIAALNSISSRAFRFGSASKVWAVGRLAANIIHELVRAGLVECRVGAIALPHGEALIIESLTEPAFDIYVLDTANSKDARAHGLRFDLIEEFNKQLIEEVKA